MKIVLVGRGHKLVDLLDSFSARRGEVVVVTLDDSILHDLIERRVPRIYVDPGEARLDDPRLATGIEDLLVVADYEEASLRRALDNLTAQKPGATMLAFTHLRTTELAKAYPQVMFRSERSVMRTEVRELIRRGATGRKVDALRRIAREHKGILVVIWGSPDPDAIASAYALRELLAADSPAFTISHLDDFSRPENKAMVDVLRIPTVKFSHELAVPGVAVATVDAQPSFFQLNGQMRFDVIIDHHPLAELGEYRYADVRPAYGSTSTILTEYFLNTGARMSRKVATALYYGLKVDTGNLTRNVSDADVNAFRWLRNHADENLVRTIELSYMPVSMLDTFGIAIANKKIARDAAFTYIGTVDNPEVSVYIADFLIKLSGISWAAVACRTREKLVVVFRSDGLRKHAGKVAERLFLDYGTAGGHRTMARAEMTPDRLAAQVPELSDVAVERWLLQRLSEAWKPLKKFLS
jgi:nanoRNase/pAp phosphatase (c-di-AMP/oligoRNAs hydrolase)